jgi:hypothetical protein
MTSQYSHHPRTHVAPAARRGVLSRLAVSTLAVATLLPVFAAEPATPAINSPFDALAQGKFTGGARYRYEVFDQDALAHASVASTVRLMLGYQSAEWNGLSVYTDVESIHALGADDYRVPNDPTQKGGDLSYPAISDPLGTELNQFIVKFTEPNTKIAARVGREALALNNGRFVSFSGWRQNNQTIDLAGVTAPVGPVKAGYAYLNQVNRVVGADATDGRLEMDSHLVNIAYAKPGMVNASLYGLFLDYDLATQAANDTASIGLRLTGPYTLSNTFGIYYTLDYAKQSDYADNAADISFDYYTAELGVDYKGHKAFAGYTVLEGDGVVAFRTPLAHPFNGWTELFLNTPANGLEALYVTFTGPFPGVKGLSYTATYYDYSAQNTSAHYGSELDGALEWKAAPIHKNLTLGWRFGQYYADTLFSDSLRTSTPASRSKHVRHVKTTTHYPRARRRARARLHGGRARRPRAGIPRRDASRRHLRGTKLPRHSRRRRQSPGLRRLVEPL